MSAPESGYYCSVDHSQSNMQSTRTHWHPPVRREAASRQGAPRQAEDEDATWQAIHVDTVLAELGIRVTVGTLVPTGPAVRLDIDDTARWLEPDEAHALASALNEAATFAVHEDRAARRG